MQPIFDFRAGFFRYGSIGVSGCEISHLLAWSLINNLCKLNLILDTQPRTQRPLCVLWLFVGQRENVTEDSEDINLDRRNPAVTVVVRMPWFSKPKSKFSEQQQEIRSILNFLYLIVSWPVWSNTRQYTMISGEEGVGVKFSALFVTAVDNKPLKAVTHKCRLENYSQASNQLFVWLQAWLTFISTNPEKLLVRLVRADLTNNLSSYPFQLTPTRHNSLQAIE